MNAESPTIDLVPATETAPKAPKVAKKAAPAKKATPKKGNAADLAKAAAGKKAAKEAKATVAKAKKAGGGNGAARERRVKVVAALRKLDATTASNAVGLEKLAEKAGVTRAEAYIAVTGGAGKVGSSPTCLMHTGHCKTADVEGVRGIAVYLTPKGKTADLKAEPFAKAAKTEG
jgi:hypothetical protein